MTQVFPTHYHISIEPDLHRFIFRGRVEIRMKIREPVSHITLNMSNIAVWSCELITEEETDVVGDYINRVADEARANGFKPRWMRMALSHTDVEVSMLDKNTAEVHLTSSSMRSPNPVFGLVSKVFFLGETFEVEETLTVVKEADGWKVCGQPYSLIEG